VRTIVVEVLDVLAQDAPQVRLVQDQEVIEALAPGAAREALADGVLPGGAVAVRSSVDTGRAATRANAGPYLLSRSRMR
jgi:hypothetical protein